MPAPSSAISRLAAASAIQKLPVAANTITRSTAFTVALCFCVAIAEGFDIQAIGVAAPRLGPELGLSAEALGWVFAIGNIGLVIGASLGGWLADRIGRKPVFVGAVPSFTGGVVVIKISRLSFTWLLNPTTEIGVELEIRSRP